MLTSPFLEQAVVCSVKSSCSYKERSLNRSGHAGRRAVVAEEFMDARGIRGDDNNMMGITSTWGILLVRAVVNEVIS
jgi:hypothetical protein